MDYNFESYVSRKFIEYPQSVEIAALQQRICALMYETYKGCKSKNMSDTASYKQALTTIKI
ncbi:MAG: hypothetical protein GXY01_09770 [Clostridiales bacterium]|nr:hypothetical protein [Clostridiales bacterium]